MSEQITDADHAPSASTDAVQSYEARTWGSQRARETAQSRLPTGITRHSLFYDPYPIFARGGSGAYVEDIDGNRYLDLVNNYTSLIHGHAHQPTVDAICKAVVAGAAPGAPTRYELELADELATRIPMLEWLRFTSSGSEAVGLALRAARAFTGRNRLLKFEGGFHGCFDEVQISVAAPPMEAGAFGPGQPMSEGVAPVNTLVAIYNDLDSVDGAFEKHGDELAAVIVEPFLGNGALMHAEPRFLDGLAERCKRAGVLLILDECQSCRLDYGGAQTAYEMTPDITVLGKTIGGGTPLAAFGGRREVMAAFDGKQPRIVQTGTFAGFPPALAAGIASLRDWDSPAINDLNAQGAELRRSIRDVFARRGVPVWVNGQGSMFNITISEEPITRYRALAGADRKMLGTLQLGLLQRGVYLTARGTGCLSTAMTDSDIDFFVERLDAALGQVPAR